MATCPDKIKDAADARAFVRWCLTTIGEGYHPDTPFADYVDLATGERCFTTAQAQRLDWLTEDAMAHLDDIYAVGLDLMHELYPATRPTGDTMPTETFLVVCRGDREPGGAPAPYELATRSVFDTPEAAARYAEGIAPSREALVVAGRFAHLRFGGRP